MISKKATLSVKYGLYGGDIMYKSIYIFTGKDSNKSYDKHTIESFESGDFIKDWYNAIRFIAKFLCDYDINYSTGIQDFIGLCDLYDKAYLLNSGGMWQLTKDKPETDKYFQLYIEKGQCPEWEEFKNYCKTI